MALGKIILKARDLLSYCGLGFLVAYGGQWMWGVSGLTLERPHRLLGLLVFLSALSIGTRLNAEVVSRSSATRSPQEQA